MYNTLNIVLIVLLLGVIILQVRAYLKLKQKNKLILVQSREIKRQILEQEKIGFYELPYISERKLQSLGIPYGPCARIIYEAQQYFISLLTLKSNGIDV